MNTLNFTNPKRQEVLKSQINFFKPTTKKGRVYSENSYDAYITIGIKGKIRTSNRYELNIKHFARKQKLLHWKYVKIGIFENDIFICCGDSADGYKISRQNFAITNMNLIISICNHFDLNTPKKSDESCKIPFKLEKVNVIMSNEIIYKFVRI